MTILKKIPKRTVSFSKSRSNSKIGQFGQTYYMSHTVRTDFCYTHLCYVSHFCYVVFELLTCRKTPFSHFCYDSLTFVTLFSSPEKVTKMGQYTQRRLWDAIFLGYLLPFPESRFWDLFPDFSKNCQEKTQSHGIFPKSLGKKSQQQPGFGKLEDIDTKSVLFLSLI